MSISGINREANSTNAPLFHELKKQASFFFKEKIKTARLALTDVTPAQILAEEATNGNPGLPDARTLKMISKAAFEVDDYWRIVGILHNRLVRFDKRNWRASYKAVVVLEHLLTHGPESVAEEFRSNKDVIGEMENLQYIDEKGFNWGLNVRKKSERVLKLLEKGSLLKQERERARKITQGIQGFGSFSYRTRSGEKTLQESSNKPFERCNSQFNDLGNQENLYPFTSDDNQAKRTEEPMQTINTAEGISSFTPKIGNLGSWNDLQKQQMPESVSLGISLRENVPPEEEFTRELNAESKPLLAEQKAETRINVPIEDHPFSVTENLSKMSLLSTADQQSF